MCEGPLRRHSSVAARDHFIFENSAPVMADYAMKGKLGKGSFSSVHLGTHKRTGIKRAIKKITKEKTNKEQFRSEIRALISLDHPHIVKVLEYFEDETDYYVVMELCTGEDLFEWVIEHLNTSPTGAVKPRDACIILRQCLKATVGCHSKGFIHRDLKLENFMLVGKDKTVKLIDFGLAKRVLPDKQSLDSSDAAGTLPYLAPEVLKKGEDYGCAVDVWSLGVMLFVMLTGEPLLTEGKEVQQLNDESYVAMRLRTCPGLKRQPSELRDLLSRMLERDPQQRITAEEALLHSSIKAHWSDGVDNRFVYNFDKELPQKMARFASAPLLQQTAQLCLVHLAAASRLPDVLYHDLMTARHIFRTLDKLGSGQVSVEALQSRLQEEGIDVPEDFQSICEHCQRSSAACDGHLDYGVLVACLLLDCHWPDFLLRETFNILDRSRNGVIEAKDLVLLSHDEHREGYDEIIKQIDPSGEGYINYDKYLEMIEVDRLASASLAAKPHKTSSHHTGFSFWH